MMKLLALDTATDACSAALWIDGEISLLESIEPRRHSEYILAMIEQLLAAAELRPGQLDGLAFGCGPGSFTGLRIAAGVAQGIAFGADLPVVPVSSLAALALGAATALHATHLLPALDARMGELYWAGYRLTGDAELELVIAEAVVAPLHAELPSEGAWVGVGDGWASHGATLRQRGGRLITALDPERLPSAREIARLGAVGLRNGEGVSAEQAQPRYLRNQVANKPGA